MTEALFLISPGAFGTPGVGDLLVVDGAEGRHAATVARTRTGDRIYLGNGAGARALAEVTGVERSLVRARVLEVEHRSLPEPRFVLVQALARGERDEQAIEAATELGVDELIPWEASRSVVRWRGDRAQRSRRRWESVVTAATKQSRRHHVPVVASLAGEPLVVERIERAALALALHQQADEPLAAVEVPSCGDVVVIVGPEGGLSPDEVARFAAAGARSVRLGSEVLRASSAGPAALAVLSGMSRWR